MDLPPSDAPLAAGGSSPSCPWKGRGKGRRHLFEAQMSGRETEARHPSRVSPSDAAPQNADSSVKVTVVPASVPGLSGFAEPHKSPVPAEDGTSLAASSHEDWPSTSHLDAATQTSERRLPANAPPAPRLMLAARMYDGIEQSTGGLIEGGYLVVSGGDLLEVRSPVGVAGHAHNRFREYVFAKAPDGRRGWVPSYILLPFDGTV